MGKQKIFIKPGFNALEEDFAVTLGLNLGLLFDLKTNLQII
jgi:hypothetical protein